MPDPLPRDPLICPRCGGPKVWDDLLSPGCAAVAGPMTIAYTTDDDAEHVAHFDENGNCIDDPPARDIPQAFGEGAD